MKTRIIYLFLVLFILSCGKKNLPSPNIGCGTNPRSGSPSKDTSFISVSIGGVPMQVTKTNTIEALAHSISPHKMMSKKLTPIVFISRG